jgi:hypothetical protein
MLKELKIEHKGIIRNLLYEVCYHVSEYGESHWTVFYEGETTKTYRKYWLFGEKITEIVPKEVFTIWFNIEEPTRTKRELSERLHRELEILGRADEIAKGELV